MKRLLIFILILVLGAGLLSGCTGPEESASGAETTVPQDIDGTPGAKETTEAAPETDAPTETPQETTTEESATEENYVAYVPEWDVPNKQLIHIGVYWNYDREAVIRTVLGKYREKYDLILPYNFLGPKQFSIYFKEDRIPPEEEIWEILIDISQIEGVIGVQRVNSLYGTGEKFPDQTISFGRTAPEMMPVGGWDPNDPESAGKENPWIEHATLAEAEKAAGFSFEIPENDLQKIYRTEGQDIIEVIFLENGEELYRLRKGIGYGNISGEDRKKYASKGQSNLDGCAKVLTWYGRSDGDDMESYRMAYRCYAEFSYSVVSQKALTGKEMNALFADDKHKQEEYLDYPDSKTNEDYYEEMMNGVKPETPPETAASETPSEDEAGTEFRFPRQGEGGREYSPDTLVLRLNPKYNMETVLGILIRKFPVEVKYDFKGSYTLYALRVTKSLTDEELAALAKEIYGMKGVVSVDRDAVNQMDKDVVEPPLVDI